MSWNSGLTKLQAILAELYPDIESSREVLAKANVPTGRITFTAAAESNWFNILEEAHRHRLVPAIVEKAADEYKNRKAELLEAEQEYLSELGIPETKTEPADAQEIELVYRLQNIMELLEDHADGMDNEDAVRLEYMLSGWYEYGDRQFEGTSTRSLLRQVRYSDPSLAFLDETDQDLRTIKKELDDRTGPRQAGQRQEMGYASLAEIRERMRAAVERLTQASPPEKKVRPGPDLRERFSGFREKMELVDALLACPNVSKRGSRELIIDALRNDIKNNIQRNAADRVEVMSLVNTALNYEGGLEELVEVVRGFEGDSGPMQEVDKLME